MKLYLSAFTDRGMALAETLAQGLGGTPERCTSLRTWTAEHFFQADALIFVGAVGIAVRAIAPHVGSKATDPAIVVVDEAGRFAIPILSGHLGGANDLARRVASLCGATPVITTATDLRGVFAVDEWAKRQGLFVQNPERIKSVSGKLLGGGSVTISSPWDITGTPPAGVSVAQGPCDAVLTLRSENGIALALTPRIAVLGVGCRKGTPEAAVEQAFQRLLHDENLCPQAVEMVCSIDVKKDEPGLLAFCKAHKLPFVTFSAAELRQVPGAFTPSSFVAETVGVDNVCERAAVLGSDGQLFVKKRAEHGVTMALALKPFQADWRWQDD